MAQFNPPHPRPQGARKFRKARTPSPNVPVSHGYFKSFDGTRIFYSSEGKGKTLVFCYGLVCSSLHWTYQIEHLRRTHRTLWFDYRGHQNSDTPTDLNSITIENIAADLGRLLDELEIKDAVFLGHSMGVNVVLELVRQRPEKVAGLILANGTAQRPLETLMRNNVTGLGFAALRKLHDLAPRAFKAFWKNYLENTLTRAIIGMGGFNPHLTPPEDIQLYVRQISEMDPLILLNLVRSYEQCDATPWLHTIDKPTLILGGEKDNVTPLVQQELMHQLIRGSKLEVIRHGSHCTQMDLPELVNMRIDAFLNEIGFRDEVSKTAAPSLTRESASPPTPTPLSQILP